MNLLLEGFFESYGLILILVVAFALIMVYYYLRNKKFQQGEFDFHNSLKVGDKVKTYSGFYGEVEKMVDTTDGRIITLKLGEGAFIDVDIRAIMQIDTRKELPPEPEKPEQPAEEVEQEPKEKVQEPKEEKPQAEEVEEQPKKQAKKPATKKRGTKKVK